MKLTNTLCRPQNQRRINSTTELGSRKNGHVWEVESEEFDNWSSQAHEITERIERLQTQPEEALHISVRCHRVATTN